MNTVRIRQIVKYAVIGAIGTGTFLSLRANDYQVNSIGIVRLTRAAVTVFNIGYTYKSNLYKHGLDKNSQEYKDLKSQCHYQAAEKLLELCCTNKGVYIKVGQHIGALDYLVPQEYVRTMKVLHSHAPANKVEDVFKVIREDLKRDPADLFETIDPEPLGAASLAQVHKGTLKDGSVVAVKVQHPYVRGNAIIDLKTMEILVKLVSWVFPDFKFQWLVDETKKNIPQELNFEQEGRNAEKVSKMFKHYDWLKIPSVRWDLTTSRVLTMDFVEGGQINDLKYIQENNIDPFEVTDKLGKLYSHMIFVNGFVHSDPHPGNILLKKSPKGDCDVILLDHGLYATLSPDIKVEYAKFWLSILNRDRKAMREHSKNLGIEGDMYGLFACMVTGRTWDSIVEGIDKRKTTKGEKETLQKVLPNVLPQISGILDNVNRQILLIFKTNDLMHGIEHTLKTGARMSSFRVMSECCIRSVYGEQRAHAKSLVGRVKITLTQYWMLFKINIYYTFRNLEQVCRNFITGQKSLEISGVSCMSTREVVSPISWNTRQSYRSRCSDHMLTSDVLLEKVCWCAQKHDP